MKQPTQFVLCLENKGNEASLIRGAAKDDLVRVIDESGEDYLFAKEQFVAVEFPQAVRRKLLALQKAG